MFDWLVVFVGGGREQIQLMVYSYRVRVYPCIRVKVNSMH